jgi:argininosuccinate lyase
MKMWGGRFEQAADAAFEDWQRSFPFDRRLLSQEVAGSKVYAAALADAGVISAQEETAILNGLAQIASEPVPADDPAIEDNHHYVEARLVQIAGEAGYKLHTGRSRNEQIATDLRLFVREQIDEVQQGISALLDVLAERAAAAGDAAMPAYTHLQPAEPVLVAHWLLSYAEMFLRDADRLRDCRARVNQCPLGSGAIAGSLVQLDRLKIAARLGFDAPTGNSIDATSDRDFAIEFVGSCAQLAMHLSRVAEEFILFASREYGFVALPEAYSTGSSAMPQKKNPDALELLRAKSGRITGNLVALLMTMKGLPQAYNKDLQECQQPLFDTADQIGAAVKIAAGFLHAVEFDWDRMQAAASSGHLNAFAAAAYLAGTGVPFRRAHEQVGAAVRLCLARGLELQDLSFEELHQCGIDVDLGEFRSHLSTKAVLAAHNMTGGTAPAQVRRAVAALQEKISAWKGVAHASA